MFFGLARLKTFQLEKVQLENYTTVCKKKCNTTKKSLKLNEICKKCKFQNVCYLKDVIHNNKVSELPCMRGVRSVL